MDSNGSPLAARFRAVLFDLDGTLADCFDDIRDATNHAMRGLGLPEHGMAAVRTFVGGGVERLCRMALGEREDLLSEASRLVIEYYASDRPTRARFYEGIPELVRDLREAGVRVGVVSNKTHALAVKTLAELDAADWFDHVLGEVSGLPRKPEPDMPLAVLERLGVEAGPEVALVGDGVQDVLAAKAAGVVAVAAAWDAHDLGALEEAGPDFVADSPAAARGFLFGSAKAASRGA